MQVDPGRLVELARATEQALARLEESWATAHAGLEAACTSLGEASGTILVQSSYGAAVRAADDAVHTLALALECGVDAILGAAGDAIAADEAVAANLAHAVGDGARGLRG